MIKTCICKQCGATFQGGPRAWYCPGCRMDRRKEREARYRREGSIRPLGSMDHCEVCGQEYIVSGGRQRYCKNCAQEAIRESDRKLSLKWYNENANDINPVRKLKRRKMENICVICGKIFPCNGTKRNTCSDECRKKQVKEWRRNADAKRK